MGGNRFFLDLEECRLFYRAEINALTTLLFNKGLTTPADWQKRVGEELKLAIAENHTKWPEVTVLEDGSGYQLDREGFEKRVKEEGWPP